jgi:Rps23 Pro-64 3,4-dihydroxylase Tpa1-like proline 4-hydroxylase
LCPATTCNGPSKFDILENLINAAMLWESTQMLTDMSIGSFLPLQRMRDVMESARSDYASAKPFPHVVIDDFFDPQLVDLILEEFPKPKQINWQKFDNAEEIKLASAAEASFGPMTRLFLYHLNSVTFLEFLSGVTGIENLISDPHFEGGGLHQIVRGGKLGVHADFNKHRDYGLDRRLNLLLYLNKDWREEYGGGLELWNREMSRCESKVLPIFNRMMIFGTTDFTYHGHPDPLQCPEGMTRKSLALYYFSNGRPSEEVSGEHSTLFRARDETDLRPTVKQRVGRIAGDFLPPILIRQLRRILS